MGTDSMKALVGLPVLLIVIDALSHVLMGHEWTVFVSQGWIVKKFTAWSFIPVNEYIAAVNATWLPAGAVPELQEVFPFTPILWDVFVVFPAMPCVIYSHCVGGAIALLSGFVQLFMLQRIPLRIHRVLGWIYALSFTLVAVTGAVLGSSDSAGLLAAYNFGAMAVFAVIPTWMAVYCAVHGHIAAHRAWMIRSYSICFSVAVLLRFSFLWLLPLMADILPQGVHEPYMILVFLSWSVPLLLSDVWLTLSAMNENNNGIKIPGSHVKQKGA